MIHPLLKSLKDFIFLFIFLSLNLISSSTTAQTIFNLNENKAFVEISKLKIENNKTLRDSKRARVIQINPVLRNPKKIKKGDFIILNLFDSKSYKVKVEKVYSNINSTLLIKGKIENFEYAYFRISTSNGESLINIDVPELNELYTSKIDLKSNSYYFIELDRSKLYKKEASDFSYFRGNIFTKKKIDSLGNLVYASIDENETIIYDTLPNGRIRPRDLPGLIKHIPVTKNDAFYRSNYAIYNNTSIDVGDMGSSRLFEETLSEFNSKPMYNSPKPPSI